jgi:hypothetical protein
MLETAQNQRLPLFNINDINELIEDYPNASLNNSPSSLAKKCNSNC